MMRPATSGVALPDQRGRLIRTWRIIGVIALAAGVVGLIAFFGLMIAALYSGDATAASLVLVPAILLLILGLVSVVIVVNQQSAQRTELADALTRAGHAGVDARRLQAGRSAPSPLGVELRLRRERDDAGNGWLLVDAQSGFEPFRG